MSAMSDYLENEILDHICSVGAYTMPSNVYVGLSTGSFGDDNSGTEISGNNYARKEASFSAASSGAITTSGTVEFNAATGTWGAISHWGLYDASTSGNLLLHGAFAAAKTITTGDILRINAGDLDVTAA